MAKSIPDLQSAKMVEDDEWRKKNLPKETFLCCWHAGNYESGAMWKIYGESRRSVAIQSTFAKLGHVLKGKASIGMVEYIDYETESIFSGKQYGAAPFLFKRKSFEYEHELRCIMQRIHYGAQDSQHQWDDAETGKEVATVLDEMIERAYVSPESEQWFFMLEKDLTARLGHHFLVVQSTIAADPIF